MRIRNAIIGSFLFTTAIGCQDKVNRKFSPIEVSINDSNEVAILDSIYFILPDTLPNRITVISDDRGADLFYSVNNSGFTMIPMETITLHSDDSLFQFYLTKEGFDDSEIKTIVLQRHSKEFLDKGEVSSRVPNSDFYFELNDKSRGMIKAEILNMNGVKLLQRMHFKNTDYFMIEYALGDLPKGIYVAIVTYGMEKKTYQFVKK